MKAVVNLFSNDFTGQLLPKQVFGPPKGATFAEEPDTAFKSFCEKWRLQGMATLDLPIALAPQLTPASFYHPSPYPGSVSPFMPDIFPVNAKGSNALALENSRMSIDAPHLEEWKSLTSTSSRQKKKIGRYARQFCLQHYWRILLQRYPQQLHKRKSAIEEAFGRYFDDNPSTIRRDGQEMAVLIDRPLSNFL